MKFKLGCHLEYEIAEDTVFIFNIEVAHISRHEGLRENVVFSPNAACQSYTSPELGNRYLRVFAPPGRLSIDYEADLDLDVLRTDPGTLPEVSIGEIPLELLPYLLPTRFVPSDRLAAFAQTEFGESSSGHERVGAICNWIYDNIEYQRGSSDEETTAAEIIIRRAGVCRDFAHLGITFCRALGIPARYLTCYAYGLTPGDFHAVFEAYLGDRWWLFDATRQAALDGLVRIGVGRDAAEVAFATLFGQATSSPPVVWIDRVDGDVEGERTTDAISVEALKDRTP